MSTRILATIVWKIEYKWQRQADFAKHVNYSNQTILDNVYYAVRITNTHIYQILKGMIEGKRGLRQSKFVMTDFDEK